MLYAASTGGFYDASIHDAIPGDAVEITAEAHAALLEAQAAGRVIQAGPDGYPVAVSPPAPTDAQLAAAIRARRDATLGACDWTQLPDAPLAAEAVAAWGAYRQALRDITTQATFPAAVTWPETPAA